MERPKPHFADVEKQLIALFYDVIFRPIVELLRPEIGRSSEINNAPLDSLTKALRAGRVQYGDGVFSGRFSAAIAGGLRDIGATFDSRAGVYRITPARVPTWVLAEATSFTSKAEALHTRIVKELELIERDLDVTLFEKPINLAPTLSEIEDGWRQTARSLEIKPELSPGSLETIRKEWTDTAKLPIKKFSVEEVRSLRKVVETNAEKGYRVDRLVDGIKARYGVSERKAKFLARNETSIFMSKFRRERFEEAGIRRYKWSTSHDERVRPAVGLTGKSRADAGNHRVLDGKVFSFDSPPIVDPSTGRRANPGEDYNCRCVAIPILQDVVVPTS